MVPYFKLFSYANLFDKLLIAVGTLFSILAGVLSPYLMILFGDATGVLVNYTTVLTSRDNWTNVEKEEMQNTLYDGIRDFAIFTSLAAAFTIAASYISGVAFTISALRQMFKMKKALLEKTLNQDIGWYDQNQTGDFTSLLTDNIAKIEDGIGEKVSMFLFFLATFLAGVVWALIRGWKLALTCLVSFPLQLAVMGAIAWFSAKYCKEEMKAYSGAGAVAEEVLSSIRTVVAFEGQNKECKRYDTFVKEAKRNNLRRVLFNSINQGFIWFLVYACYALAFWFGVRLVIEERDLPPEEQIYNPGNMVAVFFSTLIACWNFGSLGPFLEVFGMARGAAHKIFSILESEPVIHKSYATGAKPNFKSNICFNNVNFHYPSRKEIQVLQDVNLEIEFGKTVALVGHSGSGKSTVVQLLQRFYDPSSGSITVNGVNLKNINLAHLRKNVGVVSQEPCLFACSIADNIRYGKLGATMDEIINAAKKAKAHKFIVNLPHSYQTVIGERGSQLSGGQKQRIAIARALIKQPNLLILDEATSALDTQSEVEVQRAIDGIDYECTKVVIAHRLSTIRNADKLVVFDKGVIIEEGSHQELMELKGAFFNMINSQGYTDLESEESDQNKQRERIKSLTHSALSEGEIKEIEKDVEYEKQKKVSTYKSILKIMKVNSPEWPALLTGCFASLMNGVSLPLYGLVFGDIVGVLAINDNELMRSQANLYCLNFLYLGLASGVAMFSQFFSFGFAGEKLTYRLRNKMFECMLHQEMGWFDRKDNGVGALCAQLSGDAASVQGAGGSRIGLILNSFSTMILSVVFGFYLDWRIALIGFAFYPLVFASMYFDRITSEAGTEQSQKMLEKSAKIAVEAIANIKTVKALNCENIFCETYQNELEFCKNIGIRKSHFRSFVVGCTRSLFNFAYAAGLPYGTTLVISGELPHEVVFKVLEVVVVSSWSIGNALNFSSNLGQGLTAASRIFTLFKRVPEVVDHSNCSEAQWEKGHVEFSQIDFSYPTRPTIQVLNGLDLSILSGKTVALVGGSGCGKSTVIHLLERFYNPSYGDVEVDGEDINKVSLKSLRSHMGIVSQEPNLFDRTIAENISYGVSGNVSMKEIELAAQAANVHNFISSLPLGYETRLGSKGTQLSGGQKQRIAIARALLRKPKILLLDEATSALDNESEKIVQEALDKARQGRTCITIAHRLTTIQDADVICVLKDGKVAEKGSHTDLLARKGLYFEYYKLQSGQG